MALRNWKNWAGDPRSVVVVAALSGIIRQDPAKGASLAVSKATAGMDTVDAVSLLQTFLAVKGGPEALTSALSGASIPAGMALELLKSMATAGRSEPAWPPCCAKPQDCPKTPV